MATGPVLFLQKLLGQINAVSNIFSPPERHQILGSIKGQTVFEAGIATDVPITSKGAASQTANLQEWKDSADVVVARVAPSGAIVTAGDQAYIGPESAGGLLSLVKASGALANPGSGVLKLYTRDGTTAGTLKLVVRAGTAGAETTVLDNIPQS